MLNSTSMPMVNRSGDLAVSCVRDEHGAVVNFISQITDITDKVNAEERNRDLVQQLQRQRDLIAASEREYRLLIENVGDVVCHIRDDRVVWISPLNAEEVLGHWLSIGWGEECGRSSRQRICRPTPTDGRRSPAMVVRSRGGFGSIQPMPSRIGLRCTPNLSTTTMVTETV